MDQLRALKYFISVAETGSFTKSAERFHVPASSLSRRIADLEQHLGATLFQRTTRVVKLTEVGRDYYQQVQSLVRQLEQSNELVRDYHSEPMGRLRISSMEVFGAKKLLPILDEFSVLFPKIQLDIHLSDAVTTFNRDEVDIAIRGGYAPNERVIAVNLHGNHFIPLAAPSYLRKYGLPKHATELKQHHGLYYRTPNGPTPWLAMLNDQWIDVSGPALITTNSGEWLMKKALQGAGIIFLPEWVAREEVKQGLLVPIDLPEPVNITQRTDFAVYLLYQKHRYAIPKIKVAVDFIVAKTREQAT